MLFGSCCCDGDCGFCNGTTADGINISVGIVSPNSDDCDSQGGSWSLPCTDHDGTYVCTPHALDPCTWTYSDPNSAPNCCEILSILVYDLSNEGKLTVDIRFGNEQSPFVRCLQGSGISPSTPTSWTIRFREETATKRDCSQMSNITIPWEESLWVPSANAPSPFSGCDFENYAVNVSGVAI